MRDELVEELRSRCNCNVDTSPCGAEDDCRLNERAASRIEADAARLAMAREAMEKVRSFFADMAAGEPPCLLTPDGVDPNEYANAYDEASSAVRATLKALEEGK